MRHNTGNAGNGAHNSGQPPPPRPRGRPRGQKK
jgi:hypothetical protein